MDLFVGVQYWSLLLESTWQLLKLLKKLWMHGFIDDLGIAQEYVEVFWDS